MTGKILCLVASLALFAGCRQDVHLKREIDHSLDDCLEAVFQSVPLSMSVNEIHSIIVIKDGKVIGEKYWPGVKASDTYGIWSASKSFNATAVGLAIDEGLLHLDDKVVDILGPRNTEADTLELTNRRWERLTVKDLLMMSSGISPDYLARVGAGVVEHPTQEILACDLVFEPGSKFAYNSMNSYLLASIVTKVTGMDVEEYLEPRFFKPLGIRNHLWEKSTEGQNFGGWGLHITTESFAKLGLLYLQDGVWKGKRILSHEWVADATACHQQTAPLYRDREWLYGYGYQFWRNSVPGSFRADGAWSQFCFVFPDKNLVVACNAHSWNSGDLADAIVDLIYKKID